MVDGTCLENRNPNGSGVRIPLVALFVPVAQQEEHLPFKERVKGSNPFRYIRFDSPYLRSGKTGALITCEKSCPLSVGSTHGLPDGATGTVWC